MPLRAAELEVLFTADATQVEKADRDVKRIGERIEKKPITAKVDADPKGALAGMDRVETAAKRLVSNQTAIKLDADISRAEKGLDRAKQRLADLEVRALGGLDVTADVRRAEAALQKTERQLKGLTDAREMITVDASTILADEALEAFKRRSTGALGDAGDDGGAAMGEGIIAALVALPIVGTVVGIGAAAAAGLFDAFQDGLNQQVSRDRLEALTGITPEQAARLGMAAGEAYANVFGESVEANMDTARLALQFDIIDADAASRSSQRVIEGLAGIADALGEDVRPVAAAVSTLLATGVARNTEHAFDLLATGAREGVNRSEDLLDTLTEYPALFARLGLSGDEALGLISQGLEGGARNSDLAADALKEFQIRATDASTLSAEGFRMLGLNAADMTAQIAAGGQSARDGLDIVLDRLRAMEDPVARNAAAVALFGTQAEDLGAALFSMDLSTAVDQLNGVTGAAERMFDTLASNDATSIEQAQRNIEVAADGIKGALAAAFSEPLGNFAEWVSQNRGPLTEFLLSLASGALDFGRSMVISAAESTVALGEFVAGPLREAVVGLRDFLEWLPGDTDLTGLDSLITSMDGFDESTATAAGTMRDTLIPRIDEAQERMHEWADPIVQMGYLNDASLRLAESMGVVGFAADGTALSLAGVDLANLSASDSGRVLEGQIRGAIVALDDEINAAARAGESQSELAGRYNTATGALRGQLTAMGLTESQADELIQTVLRTPRSATTAYSSNAQTEQGRVENLASRIRTLPDGSVVITANTGPASNAVSSFFNSYNNKRIRVYVDAVGGTRYNIAGTGVNFNHDGNILEFMANGGLTPMSSMAQMVPPNTWRVVGDRSDVAELYAPLDGSARSWALIMEAIRRMGGTPMADGGVVGSGASSSGLSVDRPIYMEGGVLFGWLREIAGREAQLILNMQASRSTAGVKGKFR